MNVSYMFKLLLGQVISTDNLSTERFSNCYFLRRNKIENFTGKNKIKTDNKDTVAVLTIFYRLTRTLSE